MDSDTSVSADMKAERPANEVPRKVLQRRGKLFRGLSDQSRLAILDALSAQPLAVQEIVNRTGLTQPNVSNHLRCLSDCGLVSWERDGRIVRYQISDKLVSDLLDAADTLLDTVAVGIDPCENYR